MKFPRRSLPAKSSVAQSCIEDVLDLIFSQIARTDLASAAMAMQRVVSRCLQIALRLRDFWSCHCINEGFVNGSEYVRSLIRDIKLTSSSGQPQPYSVFHWLECLPEGAIRSLTIYAPDGRERERL